MSVSARPERLWIFNHHAAAPDQGAGTRHFDLGRELARRGWEVTIFAAGFNHFTGREERLSGWQVSRTQDWDGVQFVWLRTFPYQGNDFRRVLGMISYFWMALIVQTRHRAPTHVIGSTVHPLAAAVANLIARLRGAKYFFEIRDLWPQTLVDMGAIGERSMATRGLRWLERYLVEHARAVITVLPDTAEYLASQSLRPRSVAYVPNGVSLQQRACQPSETAAEVVSQIETQHRNEAFVCAYLGAHGVANELDVLLDAAVELRQRGDLNVRIVLIGDGPQKARLALRLRSESVANVLMCRSVPKQDVQLVLAIVDACVLHVARNPVHRYGMSFNKLFDYMAAAKPVIFACESSYDPVARSGAGLSVRPGSPSALADAIAEVKAMTPAERSETGRNGQRYVMRNHNIATLAKRLEAALRS